MASRSQMSVLEGPGRFREGQVEKSGRRRGFVRPGFAPTRQEKSNALHDGKLEHPQAIDDDALCGGCQVRRGTEELENPSGNTSSWWHCEGRHENRRMRRPSCVKLHLLRLLVLFTMTNKPATRTCRHFPPCTAIRSRPFRTRPGKAPTGGDFGPKLYGAIRQICTGSRGNEDVVQHVGLHSGFILPRRPDGNLFA